MWSRPFTFGKHDVRVEEEWGLGIGKASDLMKIIKVAGLKKLHTAHHPFSTSLHDTHHFPYRWYCLGGRCFACPIYQVGEEQFLLQASIPMIAKAKSSLLQFRCIRKQATTRDKVYRAWCRGLWSTKHCRSTFAVLQGGKLHDQVHEKLTK